MRFVEKGILRIQLFVAGIVLQRTALLESLTSTFWVRFPGGLRICIDLNRKVSNLKVNFRDSKFGPERITWAPEIALQEGYKYMT